MINWLIALTIVLPWSGALCIWFLDGRWRHDPAAGHWLPRLAIIFSLASGVAALLMLPLATAEATIRVSMGSTFGDLTFVPDGLAIFLAVVATVVGSLAVIFSVDYMRGEAEQGRYYSLILLFIGAMAGLALTGSLLLLFLFWEITALCSYALIAFHNDDPKAVAGGIKALIMTQVGGVGLFVGALAAYSYLGSYDIAVFLAQAPALPAPALAWIAFGFLAAAAAKSAQVPFHTWLPGAMEAPTPVSALIHAATMVNAGVYLLARFYPAFAGVPGWTTAVIAVGVLSALLGALLALMATDLKRLLAYSTVSQLGYMVYAVGVGAIFAAQFHLLSHAIFKALLFLAAGAVIHAAGTRDMRQMGGLGRYLPFTRNAFLIGALALVGIPLLNGFWSKELILEKGLLYGPTWAYLGMLAGAGITALYTVRCVWLVFYGPVRPQPHLHDAPAAMRFSLGVLVLGTFSTWLLAGPFGRLLETTLPYHGLHAESTTAILLEIVSAPATLLALMVVAVGIAAWFLTRAPEALANLPPAAERLAGSEFGFEWLNGRIAQVTQRTAGALQLSQTGQLNWNVAAVVATLGLVLLALLAGI
jgi:NADH-quinone oxidoreductase subunit L